MASQEQLTQQLNAIKQNLVQEKSLFEKEKAEKALALTKTQFDLTKLTSDKQNLLNNNKALNKVIKTAQSEIRTLTEQYNSNKASKDSKIETLDRLLKSKEQTVQTIQLEKQTLLMQIEAIKEDNQINQTQSDNTQLDLEKRLTQLTKKSNQAQVVFDLTKNQLEQDKLRLESSQNKLTQQLISIKQNLTQTKSLFEKEKAEELATTQARFEQLTLDKKKLLGNNKTLNKVIKTSKVEINTLTSENENIRDELENILLKNREITNNLSSMSQNQDLSLTKEEDLEIELRTKTSALKDIQTQLDYANNKIISDKLLLRLKYDRKIRTLKATVKALKYKISDLSVGVVR